MKVDDNETTEETLEKKREMASSLSLGRLLSDEDFKKIDTAQMQKMVAGLKRGKKRSYEDDAAP